MLLRHFIIPTMMLVCGLLAQSATTLSAQTTMGTMPPGVSNGEALRPDLEQTYASWRKAMAEGDARTWQNVTATSRQVELRNRVISEKQPWPGTFFQGILPGPDIKSLRALQIFVKGPTASAVYFGKADFGVSDSSAITDNFIVLRYLQEAGVWKFDNLRVVKFGTDPELVQQVLQGDFTFLQGPEFQPSGVMPAVAKVVAPPDYLGELWITAVGCSIDVEINGQHRTRLEGGSGKELIIGGLKEGANTVTVKIKEEPDDNTGGNPQLEIGIYGARDAKEPATRYFHFKLPTGTPLPPSLQNQFLVGTRATNPR